MAYIFLVVAFTLNATANILLKVAASRGFSFGDVLRGHFTQAHAIAALAAVLFAGNLAAYIVALERIPLSVSYPIMIGMTFVAITIASILMGEHLTPLGIIGLVVIFCGVLLVVNGTV